MLHAVGSMCGDFLLINGVLSTAALEDVEEYYRVLLYVEDDGPLCTAETCQGSRGRV